MYSKLDFVNACTHTVFSSDNQITEFIHLYLTMQIFSAVQAAVAREANVMMGLSLVINL
jgi:hypothetical protein